MKAMQINLTESPEKKTPETKVRWMVFVNDLFMGSTDSFLLKDLGPESMAKERVALAYKEGKVPDGARIEYRLVKVHD